MKAGGGVGLKGPSKGAGARAAGRRALVARRWAIRASSLAASAAASAACASSRISSAVGPLSSLLSSANSDSFTLLRLLEADIGEGEGARVESRESDVSRSSLDTTGGQPRCTGLQPGCMGLQPGCTGLQPGCMGLRRGQRGLGRTAACAARCHGGGPRRAARRARGAACAGRTWFRLGLGLG